jgi:hypothetical protein
MVTTSGLGRGWGREVGKGDERERGGEGSERERWQGFCSPYFTAEFWPHSQ